MSAQQSGIFILWAWPTSGGVEQFKLREDRQYSAPYLRLVPTPVYLPTLLRDCMCVGEERHTSATAQYVWYRWMVYVMYADLSTHVYDHKHTAIIQCKKPRCCVEIWNNGLDGLALSPKCPASRILTCDQHVCGGKGNILL